jgi:hypothetical protein
MTALPFENDGTSFRKKVEIDSKLTYTLNLSSKKLFSVEF